MPYLRMIKTMPGFPKGQEAFMYSKEGAKMWVEEGYAEYINPPKKNSKPKKEEKKTQESNKSQETKKNPKKEKQEEFLTPELQELSSQITKLKKEKIELGTKKEDKKRKVDIDEEVKTLNITYNQLLTQEKKRIREEEKQKEKHEKIKQEEETKKKNNKSQEIKKTPQNISFNFIDKYEVYYVLNEKKESNIVLYDSKKYSLTQKSMSEIINDIYYEAINKGVDLVGLFDLENTIEDWYKLDYSKQTNIIKNIIQRIVEEKKLKVVFGVDFKPIQQKIYTDDYKEYYNTFIPPKYLIKDNYSTYKEDYKDYLLQNAPNINYLISNLCNFKEEQVDYFIHWLAHKVQKPYEKITRGIVFYGAESTGKTLFFDTIMTTIFSDKYSYIGQMKHLDPNKNSSNYNAHKSQLIVSALDECYYLPSVEETLKAEITQTRKHINAKGGKQWIEYCYEDQLFFSNRELPIKAGSKRLSFIKAKTLKGDEESASEWVNNSFLPNYEDEIYYLLNVLHNVELNKEFLLNGLKNEELIEIQKKTMSLEEKFIEFLGDFETIDKAENYLLKFSRERRSFILEYKGEYTPIRCVYLLYDLFLIEQQYEKKAIDKSQLFKVLNIDTKDKEQYKLIRIEGKREYCINTKVLGQHINRGELCDEEDEQGAYDKSQYTTNVKETKNSRGVANE